jgi:hypothetical protein
LYDGPILEDQSEDSWEVEMSGIDKLPGLEEAPANADPTSDMQPAESTVVPQEGFGESTPEQLAEAILGAILVDPTVLVELWTIRK